MTLTIRTATCDDIAALADMLVLDTRQRVARCGGFWSLAEDARVQAADALRFALTAEKQPFRQAWLVAENGGALVGVIHTVRLPVPPIYAGDFGDPGLIMPESFVNGDAPAGTVAALIDAAEADLQESGAKVFLASCSEDETSRTAFEAKGYVPLTYYFYKTGLKGTGDDTPVRPATEGDLDEIVQLSARHRQILHQLDDFWKPHPEADARFGGWMTKSLTLEDRDMMVSGGADGTDGYIIAQPATRLHFPAAHDISGIGVIDDWVHADFANPTTLANDGDGGAALLGAAEAALAGRGRDVAFVVCPAAWRSKAALLQSAGYQTALTWMIRRYSV